MTQHREPFVFTAQLKKLRPTQFSVGYAEVEEKRQDWKNLNKKDRERSYTQIVIPVVIGPDDQLYPVDHHHEGRALLLDGEKKVLAHAFADFSRSKLSKDEFWAEMVMFGWCHLFDETGKLQSWKDLPKGLLDLKDDPYRSLAGFLRKKGGYAKSEVPFAEFHWANYLRHRVKDPTDLKSALKIAKQKEANFLPGWVP
jgi:hypothetical protein